MPKARARLSGVSTNLVGSIGGELPAVRGRIVLAWAEEIVEALLMLRDRLHLTMLLVEQNQAFLNALCTRSYCLEKGRLVA